MNKGKLFKTAVSLLTAVVFVLPMASVGMAGDISGGQGTAGVSGPAGGIAAGQAPGVSQQAAAPVTAEPAAPTGRTVSEVDIKGYEDFNIPPAGIAPAAAPVQKAGIPLPSGAAAAKPLNIKMVEVINGGSVQVQYRPQVYKGDDPVLAKNGEDPSKYYTTRRSFSAGDTRKFTFESEVTLQDLAAMGVYSGTGVPTADVLNAFRDSVSFTYGGYPLSSWGNGTNWRGTTPTLVLSNRQLSPVINNDAVTGYDFTADVQCNSPYALATAVNSVGNVPYVQYPNFTQYTLGGNQSGDDRQIYTIGPTNKGPGTYTMEAAYTTAGGSKYSLGATDIPIGFYDEYHTWSQIGDYAQSLVAALNGAPADLSAKPLGVVAKGTLVKGANGQYQKGDGVYVEVSILNYSNRDNAIWNVAVARDSATVDNYLKPGGVKDQMNDNPRALLDKYKNAKPEDIDLILPFYLNNVHSDEMTGTDSMIHVIDDLIDGGKAGKNISYKTFQDGDITHNYRPAGVSNPGNYTSTQFTTTNTVNDTTAPRTQVNMRSNDILNKFIMVCTLASNPDGKELFRRVNKFGLDLNRDTVFATQPETIGLTEDLAKWDPIVMLEWHGYVPQMLIEPCTAPHSQNYEPDLTLNNMVQLAYYMGKAVTGSSGLNRFLLPWDCMSSGWDDGGNVYGPMFAMLYGTMGWTIECPFANEDCLDGMVAMTYSMLNNLMYGQTAVYSGNDLNNLDTPSDPSMRKSTVLNKLEFKVRGVENIDSMDADKYFIDVIPSRGDNEKVVVGRSRKTAADGSALPFFPDYLVVPGTPDTQWNVAEALRTLDFTQRYGAKILKTTVPVAYNGVTYPAGTYLYDMRQGRRNFISEIMGKGYDASNFASMYADIYCNFPDTRGFDCVEVWSPGLFDGKTQAVTASIDKLSNIQGKQSNYIVFKSNSTDAVRFVNLLLSGRSSGPSYTDGTAPVWMLRKDVDGVGTMSDYIIETKSFGKIYDLKDNPDLGLKGCYLEGKYIAALPDEAVLLVNPVISLNTTRTTNPLDASGSLGGGAIYWALDDFLGFSSMKNADGTDYLGTAASYLRPGANVAVMYAGAASGSLVTAIKNSKIGLVNIQTAASLTNANFGLSAAPSTSSINDAAFYGTYNVDDSLYTANYASTRTLYGRGNYFSGNIPAGSKTLFRIDPANFFIGGYNPGYSALAGQTTMFSTILKGGGITGKPVQSVSFGANMFYRPHYQKYYPMLATAIFAGAAGILDDQADPVITSYSFTDQAGGKVAIDLAASDDAPAGSGLAELKLERFNAASGAYETVAVSANATLTSVEDAAAYGKWNSYRMTATDWAGNAASVETGFADYLNASAAPVKICEYYALYTSDGKLKLIDRAPAVSVPAGATQRFELDLPADIAAGMTGGCYAGVYLWNADTFAPVADKAIVK